jgi:hypothetical protein
MAEAQALTSANKHTEANRAYASMLKKRPNDGSLNYNYAISLIKSGDKEAAIKPLETALGKKINAAYPVLCELYFELYYFDEAVSTIEAYLASPKISANDTQHFTSLLEKAKTGADMLRRVEIVTIVDSMLVDKKDFFKNYTFGKDLGTLFPTRQLHSDAPEDLTAYRSQRGDRVIYADSIKHQQGLYSSFQMLDSWSDPQYLSNVVNGSGKQLNFPFVSSDGVTLYFSAQGNNSLGGYDMFVTRFNPKDNTYFIPQNVGMPFNSLYNDYLMVIDEINNIGWFATDRFQPAGKVMIYTYIPNTEKKIIQSDDKDYIRRAAQLKTYRHGKKPKIQSHATQETNNNNDDESTVFQFVINDTIVYDAPTAFKSEQALELYQRADSLTNRLKTLQNLLDGKRKEYAVTESEADKKAIQPDILQFEQEINELRNKPIQLYLRARQKEIEAIRAAAQH